VAVNSSLLYIDNILIKKYDDIEGIFSGQLVKYGNRDRQGDIILNNGCDKSALEWKNGRIIPAFYEHNPEIIISKNMFSMYSYSGGLDIQMNASNDFKNNYPAEFQKMVDAYQSGTAYFSVGISASKSVYQKIDARDEDGVYTRYIFSDVYIVEGSFTTSPANPQAKVDFMKSFQEIEYLIKNITSFSRAEEFLRKNTDLTQSQCTEFLRTYQGIIEKRNSSPAQDCQSKEPVQVQNNNASFWGEVDILLTEK